MKTLLALVLSLGSMSLFAQVNRPGFCPMVENIQCEDFIISKLHPREYDDEIEYMQIRRACAGNYGKACLTTLVDAVSIFDADSRFELTNLAIGCKLSFNPCVEYIRDRISKLEFNSPYEVTTVARACARADVQCMDRLCSLRQYNCRRKADLMRAANRCYTQCGN